MSNNEGTFIEISRILPLLPYAEQMEDYAGIAAAGLKESLRRLISSSTYVSHQHQIPDLIHKYIVHFGLRFTKKELIDIIKFGLAVAFCPQVDKVNCEKWKQCVAFLLTLTHHFIKKEELQLEWKTFQKAFMRDINEFDNCNYIYRISDLDSILINKANRYFTPSCIQEIWESERPQIYASLATEFFDGIFNHLQRFTPNQLSHFEEIKRVWLGEIFHMWYQYPTPKLHKAVVILLAKFSQHFPGRLDMEPHLDRVFNFLIQHIYDKDTDKLTLTSSAEIIVNSIVPGSNVLRILQNFFRVCLWDCPKDNEEVVKANLPFFCFQVILSFCKRVNFEFTWIPEVKEHIGEVVEWARLTKEQVDEFVEFLLPICFEDYFFFADQDSVCGAVHTLVLLRPRLVIPHVIESIEESCLTPQFPLRLTKSLKILCSCASLFVRPNVFPIWNYYIGLQPTDQLQNFALDDQISPHIRSPEQKKQWESNFFAMIFPECRMQIPRILKICLDALDLNHRHHLHTSINILFYIFMTMPIRDFSDMNQPEVNVEDKSTMSKILRTFSFRELAHSTAGVEDLVVDIWKRTFAIFEEENRNFHVLVERGQEPIQKGNTIRNLAILAHRIAISANYVPRLRVRLVDVFLNVIMQNQWFSDISSPFPDILYWLLCGPRFEGTNLSESDTALYALNQFWPLFKRHYYELKSDSSVTYEGRPDPRLIPLVNILRAFFVIFVPMRMEEVMDDFISSALHILWDLLEISLGSEGKYPPSKDLANCASESLGVLLYRLVTISMDFRSVDFFNSAGYTTDPLWTPFMDYRKARDLVKWFRPNERTFEMAGVILNKFLMPLLDKISAISDELSTYLADTNADQIHDPHISVASKQSGIANQRSYLISLISWIWNICISIFEGLKPRDISHEDVNYVNQICSELEVLRHENIACPEISSSVKDFRLDIPLFDHPKYNLRDKIFRCSLRFIEVLTRLSTKFDTQRISTTDLDQCVTDKLLGVDQLIYLLKLTGYAGFNYVKYTSNEAYKFNTHPQIPIKSYCLGFHMNYIEPEYTLYGKIGPSSDLLSALAEGEEPTLRCGGGGGSYGVSYLPIVWLMCVKRQHFNFICRAIGLNAAWPGNEALSLITNPRLPANWELNRFIEMSLRYALNCNKKNAMQFAFDLYYFSNNETPGVSVTFARLLMEAMQPFCESDIFGKSEAEYRVYSFHLKRAISIISMLVSETAFSIDLYNNDPTLWSQMWAVLLNLCISTDFDKAHLTNDQLQERVNDQNVIAHTSLIAPKTLETHQFTLYFHASYEPEAHSKTSPLRHLILSAQKLLTTLGGCKETMVKYKPLLLVKTAKLRRDAYRFLVHAIDKVCLLNNDVNSNSTNLSLILLSIQFRTDNYSTHSINAALPDVESFQRTAPPPPMPSSSTIKKVLGFLSSKSIHLADAASFFILNILMEYCLRTRKHKIVSLDWRSVEIVKKCGGFENECQYDCLSPENFTLRNHILSLVNSSNYFRTASAWIDPCSSPVLHSSSGSDENILTIDSSNKGWLELESEINSSELSPNEIIEWREGIKAIAEFFANPDSWIQLSRVFLNYHQCSCKSLMNNLKGLIQLVLLIFGPRPYLRRVEEFVMTLLQPALTPGPKNDMLMIVGSTIVNEILFYVAVGSRSWPRDRKLELFGRVLPRLIVYAEAASQRTSRLVSSIINPPISPSLGNASFIQPTKCDAYIATTTESNSCFQERTEDSPASCHLAYRIRYGDWGQDGLYIPNEMDFTKFSDPCGPNIQIRFPLSVFLRNVTVTSIVSVYSTYIWKYICELASVRNEGFISNMKESECCHNVPQGDGECPVCVGCRLFSRVDQRQALKDKMMVELLNLTQWDEIHLLKHFSDAGMGSWEKKVCGKSSWSRLFALMISFNASIAGHNKIRKSVPPTLRFYKSDVTSGDAPEFSEQQVQSALVTELISPLSDFEAVELKNKYLIGPDFIIKRYLPLLVRDLMAVLLLKGVHPSAASFALQNELLSKAAERITPATEKVMKLSQKTRYTLEKEITPRILSVLDFLTRNIWSVYPVNVLPNTSSESIFDILCRLAPLLADYFPVYLKDMEKCPVGIRLFKAFSPISTSTIMGHTNTNLVINQINRVLDFLDAFLTHTNWQTRNFGLCMMQTMKFYFSTFWKRDDTVDILRRRLRHCLCSLLEDSSINVAKTASKELSYALKYNMIEYNEEWFRELKEQSRTTNQTETEKVREAMLIHRRAGVLGLCSIIQAHTSNVPDYLPEVITEVAKHAMDPHPIGQIAIKTVNEYYYHVFRFLTSENQRKFSVKQVKIIESFVYRAGYFI